MPSVFILISSPYFCITFLSAYACFRMLYYYFFVRSFFCCRCCCYFSALLSHYIFLVDFILCVYFPSFSPSPSLSASHTLFIFWFVVAVLQYIDSFVVKHIFFFFSSQINVLTFHGLMDIQFTETRFRKGFQFFFSSKILSHSPNRT